MATAVTYESESTLHVPITRDIFDRVDALSKNVNASSTAAADVNDACECVVEVPDVFCNHCISIKGALTLYNIQESVILYQMKKSTPGKT